MVDDEKVSVGVLVPCIPKVMLVELRVRLVATGELEAVKLAVPVKLSMLERRIVELDLALTEITVGLVGLTRLFWKLGLCWTVKSAGWFLKNSVIGIA